MLEEIIEEYAYRFIAAGLSIIPLSQDTKQPVIKWGECIKDPLKDWSYKEANIAMLTGIENGYVVIDCDSKESYIGWLKHRPHTPLRVKSRKGMHFYYRHPGTYVMSNSGIKADEGFVYDVKGDRSYCVAPPSIMKGHQYQVCICKGNIEGRWLMPGRLPAFDPKWRPVTTFKASAMHKEGIRDIRKYLSHITAGEGERDKTTYRAAMHCKENNLSEADAMEVVIDWHSTNCNPPWDTQEVIEKVRRVYGRGR